MHPATPPPSSNNAAPGLPPVVPPSGRFLAQLFLIPGLIVTGAVLLLLGFSWLASGARSPERLLQNLRDANPDVKWRAAHDLTQVLLRDDQLAGNVSFSLDLTEQTRQLLEENKDRERRAAEAASRGTPSEADLAARKTLQTERSALEYLCACLGNLIVPVGAPMLNQMATQDEGLNAEATAFRHRKAVWALANLGKNVQRFDKLPPQRQQALLEDLKGAAAGSGERAAWAGSALAYLQQPTPRSLQSLGVEVTLLRAAQDKDPFVRELTALALNFWSGNAAESAAFDEVLLQLCRDDGHGREIAKQGEEESASGDEPFTRIPGLEVRYNAALALARRGSPKVRLDLLQEMLDEERLRENFRLRKPGGGDAADEGMVRTTLLGTLQALVELHQRQPEKDLTSLQPALRKLAQNSVKGLQVEAEKTLLALGDKK